MDFGRYSSLGIEFAFTFLAFGALGYLVDKWAGTYPFLMILGIFLGAAAGFVKLYYSVFPPKRGKEGKKEELKKERKDSPS
ncbi:MAG TPA: AtpZ/AtpI family protein [Planctomycetes bacterium]|nr:AtpZ/AtpI family protein [Planctomycetota bacterium]